MSDFKQRLHEEKKELDEKRLKLKDFMNSNIFYELHPVQQGLLETQNNLMGAYSNVLQARIEILKS